MSIHRKKSAVINSQVRIRNEVSQIFVPTNNILGISINTIVPVNSTGTISTSISNIDQTTAYNIGKNWLNSSYDFSTRAITSICWSPELSLFCGGSTGSYIVKSRDGISWDVINTNIGANINDMCWSPKLGIFVAVSYINTRCITSPDGNIWTARTSLNNSIAWGGVCWSAELGLFCAVGRGTAFSDSINNYCVGLSSDGITWYPAIVGVKSYGWCFVCWSAELGLFCAVAYDMPSGYYNRIMVSANGYFWSNSNNGITTNGLVCVCWSAELGLFCAVGNGGTIMISNNGYDWTTISGVPNKRWTGVCWSAELGLFCAVSSSVSSGNDQVIISRDGITWESANSGVQPNDWGNICWSPDLGIFCAVSYSEGSTRRAMITNPAYSVPITPIAKQTNKYLPLVSSNGTQEIKTKSNLSYNINNNTLNLVNLSTTNLPTCSAIPRNSNDLINKAYLDSFVGDYTQGWICDDWITGTVSGSLNWSMDQKQNTSMIASDASGHIGVLRLSEVASTAITLYLSTGNVFNYSNIKHVRFLVKPYSDVYSSDGFIYIGLSTGYNALASDSVGFYKNQGSGWFYVMNNAIITTNVYYTLPVDTQKKWILFEIMINNNIPTFYITIEGETARSLVCAPGYAITTTSLVNAVIRNTKNSIDIDYFDLKYSGFTRR